METSSESKNYIISLLPETELILDIDDLEGIIMQLDAIQKGWGMDFDVLMQEEITKTWELSNPSITSSI